MPYVTVIQPPRKTQLSFDDMMADKIDWDKHTDNRVSSNTRTFYMKEVNEQLLDSIYIGDMVNALKKFNQKYETLFTQDMATQYRTFHIPKSSGGLRRIDAPNEELKEALRELVKVFREDLLALYHTSAFAYVKSRSTVDAVKRHQQFNSRWFLKLDFSNFFGSTTPEFVMSMLSQIFPFSEVVKIDEGREALAKALSLGFLNGGLPQGTPLSPFLTNLMMLPIDHVLANSLRKFGDISCMYTRYADDIVVSCKVDFNDIKDKVVEFITQTLTNHGAPFGLNPQKTKYGSSAGKNWILGVMLNKDNQMTVGHKNKKHFKAMLDSYIRDKRRGIQWELNHVQVLNGLYSYYRNIEKDYMDYVMAHYSEKYNLDVMESIKADLKQLALAA